MFKLSTIVACLALFTTSAFALVSGSNDHNSTENTSSLNDTLTIDMDGGTIDGLKNGAGTTISPDDYSITTNAAGDNVISFTENYDKEYVTITYSWPGSNTPSPGTGTWSDVLPNPAGPSGPAN